MSFNQTEHDALTLTDKREYFKPFRYSELYELAETHRKMNWTIEEVRKLSHDIKDWKELDPEESCISVLTSVLYSGRRRCSRFLF